MKHMKKTLLFATLILIGFTSITLWFTKDQTQPKPLAAQEKHTGEALIGGSFTLINQDGETTSDLDFRGKIMLVFFGFTHCPDICPITARTFSDLIDVLGDKADQVAPIFITIDPDRDTQEVMKEYFANFDNPPIGLTGTPEQIKQVADVYKAYYAKSKTAEDVPANHDGQMIHQPPNDYNIDHSGYIYFMNSEGKYVSHFPYNATPQELAKALNPYLK